MWGQSSIFPPHFHFFTTLLLLYAQHMYSILMYRERSRPINGILPTSQEKKQRRVGEQSDLKEFSGRVDDYAFGSSPLSCVVLLLIHSKIDAQGLLAVVTHQAHVTSHFVLLRFVGGKCRKINEIKKQVHKKSYRMIG